jgi:hypothetical protein
MKTRIFPAALRKPGLYKRLLLLLCWLKVIPVSKRDLRFKLFSVPTLLSTLWGWLLVSYYIYADIYVKNQAPSIGSSNESSVQPNNGTVIQKQYDFNESIVIAFVVGTFLLILLLPGVMGHFFAHNDSVMLNGGVYLASQGLDDGPCSPCFYAYSDNNPLRYEKRIEYVKYQTSALFPTSSAGQFYSCLCSISSNNADQFYTVQFY